MQQLLKIAATFKIAAEIIKNCSRSYQKLQQLLKLQQKLSKNAATFKIAACPLWAAVIEQYFHVVLFIMLYKLVLTFKSVDETLVCDHSNESY